MKNKIYLALVLLVVCFGFVSKANATVISWDFAGGVLQPLQSAWGAVVKGDHFVATSTTPSLFPYASTTALSGTYLCLSADCRSVWPSSGTGTVTQINTTFPILGGPITTTGTLTFGGLSTSTPGVQGNLPYFSGVNTFANVATTSVTCSGSTSCTTFTAIGGSPITISSSGGSSGLSTTSPISGSNLLVYSASGAGSAYGVGTSTLSATTPLTGSFTQVGSGGALGIQVANTSQSGYLTNTDWNTFNNKGSGTVTSISVASANGFAGSSSGGATPALTLSTSITGLLKGNGTAISAASNGTDYTLITANTCGAGQFFNAATAAGIFSCGTPSGTGSGLSTSSPISAGNLLEYSAAGAGSAFGVATGTISNGTGISVTAGQSIIGSGLTITNTSPLSGLAATFPFSFSNPTLTWGGLSTSSPGITAGQPIYATGVNTIASVASSTFLTSIGGQVSGNYITALTGDVTASGPGSVAATLATVNSNVGSFGGATSIPTFTVNGKGLITAAGAVTPSIPVGDITGILPIANGGTATGTLGVTNGIEYFDGTRITNGSTLQLSGSTLKIPNLATAAGTFIAADASGNLIATTTPGGSFTNTLANGGTATTTFYNGGVVFSDSTKLTQSSALRNFFWDEVNKFLGIGTSTPKGILGLQTTTNAANAFTLANSVGSTTVEADTIDTGAETFLVASSSQAANKFNFAVDKFGHVMTGGTAPSCSTNCSAVSGDDNNMVVTTGSSVSTAIVTFASPWKNSSGTSITPTCVANEESGGVVATNASSTPTNVTLEFASALTTKLISVQCMASDNFSQ